MKANLNSQCRVKLTEVGKKMLDNLCVQSHPTLYSYSSDGYFTSELWDIMHVFGKYLYNGSDSPIEMEIEILEK